MSIINKLFFLDWYDFNTCIIQHFGMVNIKSNDTFQLYVEFELK